MENNGRTALLNILTIVVLAATVCLVSAYALMGLNIYNPFPAPTRASLALPTDTPTPAARRPFLPGHQLILRPSHLPCPPARPR